MKIGTIIYTTLKLTLVGVLAGFAGYLFNLDYLLTGVLGILSISPTKKDSLKLGIKRYSLYGPICRDYEINATTILYTHDYII